MTHPNIAPRPVDALIPYARNSRTHSESQIAQIAASIDEFGMVADIEAARKGNEHGTTAVSTD